MRVILVFILLIIAHGALAASRTVTDDAGRQVSIPESPERIIVLHEPGLGVPLADLGVAPIGSYGRDGEGKTLLSVDFYKTILGERAPNPPPVGIGPVGNIDLEKIRGLNPDLIVGSVLDVKKVKQLAAIAPVYLQNISTGRTRGFDTENDLAKLLDREDVLAKRKAEYLKKIESVKATLPADPKSQTYLAVFLTDQINAVGEMSGAVQALEDLGFSRLKLESEGAVSGYGSTLFVPLSSEIFGKLNPDVLVVMDSFSKPARDEAATRRTLDQILPGWERFLKPAREGRLIFADSAMVTTPSIASAEHMLEAVRAWAENRK